MFKIILFAQLFLIISCKQNRVDKLIKSKDNQIVFDVSLIDTLIKKDLQPLDSSELMKYVESNHVIKGVYSETNDYQDGFCYKQRLDSIREDLILYKLHKYKYFKVNYQLPKPLSRSILIAEKHEPDVFMSDYFALYILLLEKDGTEKSTLLLTEKYSSGGFGSFEEKSKSIINIDKQEIVKCIIRKTCGDVIVDGKGSCMYDTCYEYFKMPKDGYFYPFKRTYSWTERNE